MRLHVLRRRAAALSVAISGAIGLMPLPSQAQLNGETRLRADALDQNPESASRLARDLSAIVPSPHRSELGVESHLRWRYEALYLDAQAQGYSNRVGDTRATGRVNEAYALVPVGGVSLAAGRRVIQWDVAFGFRPNDLIQQDPNRYLISVKPKGRTVLQAEAFRADASLALVFVNPENLNKTLGEQRGAEEPALAGSGFLRSGSTDLYSYVRWGKNTRLSVGAAFVGVVSDSFAVHASARALQRRDSWVADVPSAAALLTANPWQQATLGRTGQLLLGANWTGESRQSVLVEWWYDGRAVSDRQWDAWLTRTGTLSSQVMLALEGQPGPPADALAANLAWQDTPLGDINQRRSTMLVRLSWQPDRWLLSLDALYNPVDSGQIVTAGVQWQGDRVRLNAALRRFGGPSQAIVTRLPERTVGLLAATWSY